MNQLEIVHMSFANIFYYKGVTIDWHEYMGPRLLRRTSHAPRNVRNISYRTWGLVDQFWKLTKEEKEQFRIY